MTLAVVVLTTWFTPDPAGRSAAPGDASFDQPTARVVAEPTRETAGSSPNERQAVPDQEPPALASFEATVEQLVTLGMRVAELAQQDEIDAAKAADQEARQLFSELMTRFPDAGERGLAMLACVQDAPVDPGTPSEPSRAEPSRAEPSRAEPSRDHGRCIVLKLVLETELARRDAVAVAAADRTRIDPLVQALLDLLPLGSRIADTGEQVLSHRPWLRLVHEPAVLGLVRLAAEAKFSRAHATNLLLTLWNNLQQSGERSSEELSRLALMLLADADPSQRTAACRQLLADPRYRDLVLSWLRERNDQAVASEIACLAAHELPPADALHVLRELAPVLPRSPAAYVMLGYRAPELLADSYRELLASNTQPGWRSDLITGIGMTTSGLAIEMAQLALENDPSPDVRIQAMFTLTSKRQADVAERAMQLALDDPRIAQDPLRLGAVVLALQNLEAGGHCNELDRIGQRLRGLPLADGSRQTLEAILARALPGGETSAPARLPR
ncbi:MAG TPA: hypothetical protein VF384_00880 [Planctomycetota bacterium]